MFDEPIELLQSVSQLITTSMDLFKLINKLLNSILKILPIPKKMKENIKYGFLLTFSVYVLKQFYTFFKKQQPNNNNENHNSSELSIVQPLSTPLPTPRANNSMLTQYQATQQRSDYVVNGSHSSSSNSLSEIPNLTSCLDASYLETRSRIPSN